MTIESWIICIIIAAFILVVGGAFTISAAVEASNKLPAVIAGAVTLILIVGVFKTGFWYYSDTASGQRALTDQKSELNGGLERKITIYTADGKIMAQYEGKIDIEGNDGGYVIFDYNGKRYTYYNCFVESIADIE